MFPYCSPCDLSYITKCLTGNKMIHAVFEYINYKIIYLLSLLHSKMHSSNPPSPPFEKGGLRGIFIALYEQPLMTVHSFSMSMLILTHAAACVSAPTEIISTPVIATSLTLSRLIPPEASISISLSLCPLIILTASSLGISEDG